MNEKKEKPARFLLNSRTVAKEDFVMITISRAIRDGEPLSVLVLGPKHNMLVEISVEEKKNTGKAFEMDMRGL